MLQLVISKKVIALNGDVILVGKFVQMIVTSTNQLPIAMSGLDVITYKIERFHAIIMKLEI